MSGTNVKCRHIANVTLRYGDGASVKHIQEFVE